MIKNCKDGSCGVHLLRAYNHIYVALMIDWPQNLHESFSSSAFRKLPQWSEVEQSLTVAGYKEVVAAGLCRNREPIGDKVSFSLYTSRYVYLVTARYFDVVVFCFYCGKIFCGKASFVCR